MSTILAGILHGLDNELPLQEEGEGNGLEQEGLPFPDPPERCTVGVYAK